MAYTGAWRRSRLAPVDRNPNLGGTTDLRHLRPIEPEAAVPARPHNLPVVPPSLYAADDFMLPAALQLPASPPLDRTPEDPAAGGAPRGAEATAHDGDVGGPRVAHYYTPDAAREHDASYRTERAQAAVAVSQSRGQLVQGIDRDGVQPQGHYVNRWIDRRFTRRTITPDAYPLYPYRAAVPKQSPAIEDGNQYTSPFDKIASAYKRRIATPQVRRVPPQYAEAETTDGTETVSAGFWEF